MKKNGSVKFLRYMRNLFFLLLISASSVWARDVYSQGAQEMFSVKSGTIESIFKQIKKQSDYEFFYNTAILDVKQNVMLTSTSGTLDEILAQVLGKKYEYQVKDNYVLISEKKVSTPDEVKKVTIKGVVKDKKGEVPVYTVFFKVKDTDAVTQILQDYSEKQLKKSVVDRPSILGKLKKFKEMVAALPKKVAERKKERVL